MRNEDAAEVMVGALDDSQENLRGSSTAQGASMALEDAAVLAQCLRDIPAISEGLAIFEKLRRDRVKRIARPAPVPRTPPRRARRPGQGAGIHRNGYSATTSTGTQLSLLQAKLRWFPLTLTVRIPHYKRILDRVAGRSALPAVTSGPFVLLSSSPAA